MLELTHDLVTETFDLRTSRELNREMKKSQLETKLAELFYIRIFISKVMKFEPLYLSCCSVWKLALLGDAKTAPGACTDAASGRISQ